MQAEASGLRRTQREIARLLRAPDGVRAALAEAGDPEGRSLAPLVCGDARLDAVRRLEVYAHAYFFRILEALRKEYEALAEAIGEAGFHDLVTAYLLVHPSRNPSLRWAGARLPEFLREHAAAEAFRRRWPWAADLARLEWAASEAFDAPDAPAATRAELAAVPPERWEALRLRFLPATRLVCLEWPVHLLREAAPGARTRTPDAPARTAVCVWRRDDTVQFRALEPLEAELLERVQGGATFGALCERLAAEIGEAQAPARAAVLLASWVDRGLLLSSRA
jgi:hypothetical protein